MCFEQKNVLMYASYASAPSFVTYALFERANSHILLMVGFLVGKRATCQVSFLTTKKIKWKG